MKTTRTLTLIGLFLSIFVIVSCHKNDVLSADEAINAKSVSSSIVENTIPASEMPDCNTHCINPEGPFVELTGSQTQDWGSTSSPHSKTVSYSAYNTATSFIVKVTFDRSNGNASNTVSATAFGSTQSVITLASGATATFTFDLPSGWQKCTNVPFSIYQEGQNSPVNISASYNLYAVCVEDKLCENSFSGEAVYCGTQREAIYTFISKDDQAYFKIQGGLTSFTGADAIIDVTGGSDIIKTQWTSGGSTNRVIKVEGSVEACEIITIRITWNSTNSGGIITGSWSVKDANGVEIAPEVGGLTCSN
jgi:hypothetical protein